MGSGRKAVDLTGQQFGELTVLCRDINGKRTHAYWKCRCSCGKEVVVRGSSLRNGVTRSCGHLQSNSYRIGNF